jgi:hypothetical protein
MCNFELAQGEFSGILLKYRESMAMKRLLATCVLCLGLSAIVQAQQITVDFSEFSWPEAPFTGTSKGYSITGYGSFGEYDGAPDIGLDYAAGDFYAIGYTWAYYTDAGMADSSITITGLDGGPFGLQSLDYTGSYVGGRLANDGSSFTSGTPG